MNAPEVYLTALIDRYAPNRCFDMNSVELHHKFKKHHSRERGEVPKSAFCPPNSLFETLLLLFYLYASHSLTKPLSLSLLPFHIFSFSRPSSVEEEKPHHEKKENPNPRNHQILLLLLLFSAPIDLSWRLPTQLHLRLLLSLPLLRSPLYALLSPKP